MTTPNDGRMVTAHVTSPGQLADVVTLLLTRVIERAEARDLKVWDQLTNDPDGRPMMAFAVGPADWHPREGREGATVFVGLYLGEQESMSYLASLARLLLEDTVPNEALHAAAAVAAEMQVSAIEGKPPREARLRTSGATAHHTPRRSAPARPARRGGRRR